MASYGGRDIDNFADKIRNDKKKLCALKIPNTNMYLSVNVNPISVLLFISICLSLFGC